MNIDRIIDGFIEVVKSYPGLENQFSGIDADVLQELRSTWITIIRKTLDRKNYKSRVYRKRKRYPNGILRAPKGKDALVVVNVLRDMSDRRGLRQEYEQLRTSEQRTFKKKWLKVVRDEMEIQKINRVAGKLNEETEEILKYQDYGGFQVHD